MIKKVNAGRNFRTLLSKREEWERKYTDYNLKENTVKWYTYRWFQNLYRSWR